MKPTPIHAMLVLGTFVLAGTLAGCDRAEPPSAGGDHADEVPQVATNRVAIPASVRSNLGITFVQVERRHVEQTLRVPGRFEYLPTAHREYRAMLPGRVELLVEQFDTVEAGTPLYTVDSPAWFEHQEKLVETRAAIERLAARLASYGPLHEAHREHARRLEQTIGIRADRVEQLEAIADTAGGRRQELNEARDKVSTAEAELAEVLETEATMQADEAQARTDLDSATARFGLLLDVASTLLREPVGELERVEGGLPRWRAIKSITVRAETPGVVESIDLASGAWASPETGVLGVVQPERLRFRASGLQSDLGVLRDGLATRIVPPTPTSTGKAISLDQTMTGALSIGLTADADDRTIELFVTPDALLPWARSGVSAQLEIVTDATASPVPAIPLAAVQRDGLVPIIFRRAPDNPNEAIRMEADLGRDDGRWIALLSGVREGDEVVLDGAFQLMLATSGSIQKGGHFHSDGTFHDGEH